MLLELAFPSIFFLLRYLWMFSSLFNYVVDNLKEKTDKNTSKSTFQNKENNLTNFENALDNIVRKYFN